VTLARWDPEWETMAPLPGGDVLVISHEGRYLVRIPATGGAPVSLGRILCADSAASFRLVPGRCLVDDRTMLLRCDTSDSLGYHVGIAVLDLSSRRVRIMLRDGENPVISPTGHLLFMRGDALFGLRCDSHGVPRGTAVGLIEEVRTPGYGITLSSSGTLVYRPGGRVAERRRLVIGERDGKIVPWSDDRKVFVGAHALSRDGGRAAIEVVNEHNLGEIWIADLQRRELSRTLTAAAADLNYPCLSPDGNLIVYRRVSTDSSNGIYLQRTNGMGDPVRLLSPRPDQMLRYYPLGWSADGSTLYLDKWIGSRAGLARIRVAPTRDTVVQDLFRRQDSQAMGGIPSPNGRWLAFQWDQTGRAKVYVAELYSDGSLGEARRLSYRDAAAPRWSGDGRTIYWNEAGNWVAAPFEPSSGQISGQPRVVLDRQSRTKDLAVLPDGRLFAIQGSEEETNSITELNVVLHWTHELEEKMRGATR
jgi:Tol biopolymer transport system component